MLSLGVNTSLSQGQLCLFSKSLCLDVTWEKKGSHSERITESFIQLLKQNSIELAKISKIYCVVGPGSFTGIRVGVNFSRSLAYALNIPVIPLSSLDLLALNCEDNDVSIVSALDAQKNSFYISEYSRKNHQLIYGQPPILLKFKDLNELFKTPKVVCGDGFDQIIPLIDRSIKKNMIFNSDYSFSDLKKFFNQNIFPEFEEQNWSQLQPLYLKLSSPEEKLNQAK